jgi:hypothetical protein
MMRVEINMDDSVRGLVAKYGNEEDKTMPEAYSSLIMYGLIVSSVDFPTFRPNVDLDEDIMKVATMDSQDYEIVIDESDEEVE